MRAMQPRDGQEADEEPKGPFDDETNLRVLGIQERRPMGHEIQCITEPSLHIVRSRVTDVNGLEIGKTIALPSDHLGPLSEVRLKDLSGSAQEEIVAALSASVKADSDRHLGFYNRANNLSLKFHSFQLLPGIGNAKAIQMVQARGLAGWSSFEEIDEACRIDSVRLLAERYFKEMQDVAQTPRLLDLLVRSEL
jgi:predicted nucleic acid-binding OB-fold protein